MGSKNRLIKAHSAGEVQKAVRAALATNEDQITVLDTLGRRVRVERMGFGGSGHTNGPVGLLRAVPGHSRTIFRLGK